MTMISIHAPRAGARHFAKENRRWTDNFNPRAPCGGATLHMEIPKIHEGISIHAPRAGARQS